MTNLEKGIFNENLIAKKLQERTDFIITQKHTNGVDIKVKNNFMEISIEIKSANYWVSNGIHKYRKGKFYFYTGNLSKPDYYAFVINYPKKDKTYWVRCSEIIKYFKNHNLNKKKLGLSIPALLRNVRRIDFSEVIKKEWLAKQNR